MVRCWPWSSLCWGCLNFQSLWIPSRVFLRALILFLQSYHITHHHNHPVVVLWLLLVLAVAPLLSWPLLVLLLLLLFIRCLSVFPVHIPYSPSSCYTIKKQYHVRSAAFLQVHLVLLSQVLLQRCIILKLYISKMYSSFTIRFWEICC